VTVFTPAPGGGTTSALPFTVNAPLPGLTQLNPGSATAGGGGFTLTVTGTSFFGTSVVRWNGADRATTFVSPTQLTAAIPAADLAAAGSRSVTVFTPAPAGGLSSALTFTIDAPPPPPSAALSVSTTGTGSGVVVSTSGAINCGSACQTTVAPGTVVTVTALPAGDASFDGWSGACSGTDPCSIAVNGATSVTATFTRRTPLELFVSGFYQNILGRVPSQAEIDGWVAFLLANPGSPGATAMVQGFFNSAENLRRPMTLAIYVQLLYRTILQREPSDGEVTGWINGGMLPTLNLLVPGFVGSPEFQDLLRRTPPSEIIHRLYVNVLGRPETPAENQAWVDVIARTGDWQGVAIGFLNSPEYVNGTRSLADHVTVLYRTFLGRTPDEGGLNGWLALLADKLGAIQLGFTLSPEFQGRVRQLF
jgi:hypothetical protein